MNNGFKHEAPFSFQIRPFRNFSISPGLTYTGVLYSQEIEKRWEEAYFDENTNTTVSKVVTDTIIGASYGQALNPSINASFSPQLFGMYVFTNPNSRLQAIRHVVKPSIGFSFIPSLAGLSSDMYRQVQVDTLGNTSEYSIYEGSLFGTPSLSTKSGNISLSLTNIIEGKMFEKEDTTGKPSKIRILDNLGVSTSYNIFADSLRWAPLSLQARTTIFNNFNISASSSFSFYGVDSQGKTVGDFLFSQNRKLMRLTNLTTSVDFSLSELLSKKKDNKTSNLPAVNSIGMQSQNNLMLPETQGIQNADPTRFDPYGYSTFDVPWSLNVSYSMNYYKQGSTPTTTQTLSLSGNASLTKKTKVSYTSGYDFKSKEITMTQIGISRDLHCWEMNVSWIPNGTLQSWSFTLRAKASIFSDLKYERKKDFHDSY
jgi:hypothetical protein